jgi:hypothetical protein
MNGAHQTPITLAQQRGLIKSTVKVADIMTQAQWKEIERNVIQRLDAYCPICMEGFNQGYEILLSCSHMYHKFGSLVPSFLRLKPFRNCLHSFEKFQKSSERCCPICR